MTTIAISTLNPSFAGLRSFGSFASESFSSIGSTISTNFSRFIDWASGAKAAAIAQRQGKAWECIDRLPAEQGYDYLFRFKNACDPTLDPAKAQEAERIFAEKMIKLYPAVEPDLGRILLLDPEMDVPKWLARNNAQNGSPDFVRQLTDDVKTMKIIQSLGYRYRSDATGHYLYLPDREALTARLTKLREKFPETKVFNIVSSDGIASDNEFIEAFLAGYDALLSSGPEFIHDHIYHIIPAIQLMLTDPQYIEHRLAAIEVIRNVYQRIRIAKKVIAKKLPVLPEDEMGLIKEQLSKIETSFGVMVDIFWAVSSEKDIVDIAEDIELFTTKDCRFVEAWNETDYAAFGQRRFSEKVDTLDLKIAWKLMSDLEQQYKALNVPQD
jgi:hypothetical protein